MNDTISVQGVPSLPASPGSRDPAALLVAHICRPGNIPPHPPEVYTILSFVAAKFHKLYFSQKPIYPQIFCTKYMKISCYVIECM